MKCKHGDLAIIDDDFEGCKGNIGLIVRVIGPAKIVKDMVCWRIIPLTGQKMWLLDEGVSEKESTTRHVHAIHPDKWLSPVKGAPIVCRELELS